METDHLMQQTGQVAGVHSRAEVDAAIEALTDETWARLRKISALYASNRPVNPDDLLQEAILRALEGNRHCPRAVSIIHFLAGAMKSIAFDEVKKRGRRPEGRAIPILKEDGQPAMDLPDTNLSPEEQAIDAQECGLIRQSIHKLFSDNQVYEVIVDGIMEGLEGDDLRALTDLDATGFASARRLIRRRIGKAFPKGTRP